VSTAFKVAALAALILLGFALGGGTGPAGGVLAQRASVGLSPFLVAMVSILWAYDGWGDLAFIGGEVTDPERNLPRALLIGTGAVVLLYLSANIVYLHLIPIEQMKHADLVAADAARLLVGPAGVVAVSAAVAVSTFGTLNGSMMTAPRIFFAMAEDGLFPRAISRVDPKTGAPANAVALAAVLGVVFVLVRSFTELAEQFIIGIWPFYALALAAVFVLRRRPGLTRGYSTWGYPWVPGLFLVGSLFLLGNYLVSEPVLFTIDVAVVLSGIPVYFVWTRFLAPS
jgi:amino acid transporter